MGVLRDMAEALYAQPPYELPIFAELIRRERYMKELEAGFCIPRPPQKTIRFRRWPPPSTTLIHEGDIPTPERMREYLEGLANQGPIPPISKFADWEGE